MFTHGFIKIFLIFKILGILSLGLHAQCPPPTPIIDNQTNCEPSYFIFNAPGIEINWYNNINATTPIFIGNTYNTPLVTDSIVLFVSSKNTPLFCESSRKKVVGLIKSYVGDTSIIGNNLWVFHCYDKSGPVLMNRGKFEVNSLEYNSELVYDSLASPKTSFFTSTKYEGCNVSIPSHLIKGKRRGFVNGNYQIQIPRHEGACKLVLNGKTIYQRNNRNKSNRIIWTGPLDSNSLLEFEYDNKSNKSLAILNIGLANPLPKIILPKINGSQTICPLETPNTLIVNSYKSVAVHDAYVQDGSNASRFYGLIDPQNLATKSFGTGENKLIYLNFDISNITGGISIAKLNLLGFNSLGINPNQFAFVHALDDTLWNESTLRWSNRPIERNPFIARTVINEYVNTIYHWDITNHVSQLRALGRKKMSLVIKNTDFQNFNYTYASKENVINSPPTLLINEIESPCEGLTFQWQSQNGCMGAFNDIPNANSKVFYQPPSDLVGDVCYRLVVNDNCNNITFSDTSKITVNNPLVIANDVSNCGADSINLIAKGYSNGQYKWYNTLTSNSVIGTDSVLKTSFLSKDTSFYVTGFKNGCEGFPRKRVNISILPIPNLPQGTDNARCGEGPITLTASSIDSIMWYKDSIDTKSINIGTNFYLPSLKTTTKYFVKARSKLGCYSNPTKITAVIHPIPTQPNIKDTSRCGPGRVYYNNPNVPQESSIWYLDSLSNQIFNKKSLLDTTLNSNFSFYISNKNPFCESNRKKINVNILPIPLRPISYDTIRCDIGNITLNNKNAELCNWYLDSSKTQLLQKNTSKFEFLVYSDTTIYLAKEQANCESPLAKIKLNFDTTPLIPIINDTSSCGSASFELKPRSNSTQLRWYNDSNQLLSTSSNYITPILNKNERYAVAAYNRFCQSDKKSFDINIIPIPNAPLAYDTNICNEGNITLLAKNALEPPLWFTDTSSTSFIQNNSYSIFINTDSNVYIKNKINNCTSKFSRIKVNFASTPPIPLVSDTSNCGPASFVIKPLQRISYNWYDSTKTLIMTGSEFNTPLLSTTNQFFATALNKHCESTKKAFLVSIKPLSKVGKLTATDSLVCENTNSGTISIVSKEGGIVQWLQSDDNINYQPLPDGKENYTFNNLTNNKYYKVEIKNEFCPSVFSSPQKITVKKIGNKGELKVETFSDNGGTVALFNYSGKVIKFELSKDSLFVNKTEYLQSSPIFEFDYLLINSYLRAVTDNGPCGQNITEPIKIENIKIFNSFSPNGDQINDTWVIEGLNENFTAKVLIFNRQGQLIYEENNYNSINKVWDGKTNGSNRELEEGTYFYNVKIGNKSPILGYVVLKR